MRQPRRPLIRLAFVLGACAACALAPGRAVADPSGFAFLEVPAGARASALGGAYASVGDGVGSVYWNPAGLAAVHGIELTGTHYEFLQHLRHDQFAVAGRMFGGGVSGSLRAMYSEPIVSRDELGNETGTFGAHDLEFLLGYGASVGGGWALGGNLKALRERIDQSSATTWALDAGTQWAPPRWSALRLGAALQNLGPAGHYKLDAGEAGAPVPLPMALQAGATYRWALGDVWGLRGALESRATRGRTGVVMTGLELAHDRGAALRAGWRINDPSLSWTIGVGYAAGPITLDYAFVPFKLDLGDTHRVSLGARF